MARLIRIETMKSIQVLGRVLALGGLVVVAAQVLYLAANPRESSMGSLRLQLAVVFLGLAMNQIGVLKLAEKAFTTRRFVELRKETGSFLELVSELNERKLAGDLPGVDGIVEKMHDQIDELHAAAGMSITQQFPAVVAQQSDDPATEAGS